MFAGAKTTDQRPLHRHSTCPQPIMTTDISLAAAVGISDDSFSKLYIREAAKSLGLPAFVFCLLKSKAMKAR